MGEYMVTQQQLAQMMDRDRVTIYRLHQKGLPHQIGEGKNHNLYPLPFSIHWIMGNDFLQLRGGNHYQHDPGMVAAISHVLAHYALAEERGANEDDIALGVDMIADALEVSRERARHTYTRAMGFMEAIKSRRNAGPRMSGQFV